MYRVKHIPTGKYAKSAGYGVFPEGRQYHLAQKGPGKVFINQFNLGNAPEFELVRTAVLDEIKVKLIDWGFCFGRLQEMGLTVNQTYPNGYELMDQIRKAGMNVALVSSNVGHLLLVDNGLFTQR